ncbi:MAG TPA: aldehyde dehydrogenase family protein [Xanthobacteraceae bacterium]|nr:aldehyde dehydrogenase family protein [Xanthobacteraceae bacterium]
MSEAVAKIKPTARPFPDRIGNWIAGVEMPAAYGEAFEKISPHDGSTLCRAARSQKQDVEAAVAAAAAAQPAWAQMPAVQRGDILHAIAMALAAHTEDMAQTVALETGKSLKDARGETKGAIQQALFMAGEGMRLFGRTTTSAGANKQAMTLRAPLGVAGLIIAANTPIANVAWKVFPALICGNAAVLKASEDAPATAWLFGEIAREAGLPDGVLNIIQGLGAEAGRALVADPRVAVVSFTGSTAVGREIARVAGERLAKISLELGGKNPFVVCDDADLDAAVEWVALSAFSNAGQRCASGSRVIVFDAVYDAFKAKLLERTRKLKVGPTDNDDFGPVINERQLTAMLAAIERARAAGASVLIGGTRLRDPGHAQGCYLAPTIIEGAGVADEISVKELFGPILCLYRVKDFEGALALANDSPYGLTACIHTRSLDRASEFIRRAEAGTVSVNAGTYGSEPHMPFGGVKQSGNGSREPGTEAIDFYSNLKNVYITTNPARV